MSSKKWFLWRLPFGDKCSSRCEIDLHNAYCMFFPALAVILILSLIGILRRFFTYEFLKSFALSFQEAMGIGIAVFLIFFTATWRYQKKITIWFFCRRCGGRKEKN